MRAAWQGALTQLRSAGHRTALSAAGIFLAAAMAGAAVVVAYGLGTGFDRSARAADLPDVIARFADQPPARIRALVHGLPNVAAAETRIEVGGVRLEAGDHTSPKGALQLVDTGPHDRRGYALVGGRDLSGRPGEVVLERGLATSWGLRPGDDLQVGRLGTLRVVGVAVSPDNVAFPLASAPRVYVSADWLRRETGVQDLRVNQLLLWTRDPARTDVTLQQARATSFGIGDLRFITRSGVRVLVDQAAGIVIALLVAFSLVALVAAAVMLAAQAGAEVQRRLQTVGVQRALGVPRGVVAAQHGLAAALVALGAGMAGLAAGALAVSGPAGDLLATLNERGPGLAVLAPLAGALAVVVAVATAAAAWPAWRAAGRPPVVLLRGAELASGRGSGRGPRGFLALGARLALARRGRACLAVAVLAVSGAVILLMLGLASLVAALRDDPGSVGKRYALTAHLPADRVGEVRALPGVADAAPRYVVQGADSYALGEPVKLLAFPGDHTRFEDPPLAAGRRLRGPGEAEVGLGLADALGVRPGGTLAVQLASGAEVRFRVVGTVRALDSDGRIAYVRPDRLLAADPDLGNEIVVRLRPGAHRAAVSRELAELGARPDVVGGATTRSGAFLGTLVAVLRAVAIIDALVCLYALVQALALTARERRPTLAVLRAAGAGARTVGLVLAGAALALALPAAALAVVLERVVLAPAVGRLAAGYADLGPGAGPGQAAAVAAAFAVIALGAAAWVARRTVSEPPVAGLREE
ncbi:MAG: putative transport system permease protein [Solirubrobacteraceae bacterium]|jgi:hypothetical protein|nr:putative transport system permease protein [Solirubrobacteraceae bacterium]